MAEDQHLTEPQEQAPDPMAEMLNTLPQHGQIDMEDVSALTSQLFLAQTHNQKLARRCAELVKEVVDLRELVANGKRPTPIRAKKTGT